MSKAVLAALASALLIAAPLAVAQAADLPARAAPIAPIPSVPPVFSWDGVYFGVHAGAAITRGSAGFRGGSPFFADAVNQGRLPASLSLNSTDFIGGVHAGYNVQLGSAVVGLEADLSYLSRNTSSSFTAPLVPPLTTTASSRIDVLGTVRTRIGFAADRFLPYITGGLAYGRVKSELRFTQGAATTVVPTEDLVAGWTIGAGVDYALTDAFVIRAEYLYYDLGTQTVRPVAAGGATAAWRFRNDGHILRAGASYRF